MTRRLCGWGGTPATPAAENAAAAAGSGGAGGHSDGSRKGAGGGPGLRGCGAPGAGAGAAARRHPRRKREWRRKRQRGRRAAAAMTRGHHRRQHRPALPHCRMRFVAEQSCLQPKKMGSRYRDAPTIPSLRGQTNAFSHENSALIKICSAVDTQHLPHSRPCLHEGLHWRTLGSQDWKDLCVPNLHEMAVKVF